MHRYTWRIICSILLFILTHNLLAALVGFIVGSYLDQNSSIGRDKRSFRNRIQEIFFNTSFQILGYIAKSDGRVSSQEIEAAERIMRQMELSPELRKNAINLFNEGKQPGFKPQPSLLKLRQACNSHPHLLQMFIQIQLQMAYAESNFLSPAKETALRNICNILGVSSAEFTGFNYNQRQYSSHGYSNEQVQQHSLKDDYKLLNISSDASDVEVKKAYRKAMSQNHPDRMIAEGVPPEMVKMATQKTQEIKAAYERIKAARNVT